MQNYKNSTKILLICAIVGLIPCFSFASRKDWKDSVCGIYNLDEKWCKMISNNYTEPYCITNFYHDDRESSDVNYAESCIFPAFTNKISSLKEKEITLDKFDTRDTIQQFCLSLFWKSDTWRIYFAKPSTQTNSWDWQQTFDSHQSLFLYALCSSFSENWKKPFIITENALLWDVYKWEIAELLKLKQLSNWKDLCSLDQDSWLTDCDMAIYATKIYAGIMSDLFKIKYAQVLHINTTKNFESEKDKKIMDFMSWYYLMKDEKKDGKNEKLKDQYPKTISILQSNQKYYKNVLDTVKIIKNSELADIAEETWCPTKWNMTWINFIACALHSSQWDGFSLTPSFVTLFYNELLHYNLFVSYYQKQTEERIKMMSKENIANKNIKILEAKMLDFKQYFDMQMEASKRAQRSLEEFNMTYPLHIRLLLHIEKAEKFRNNSLSKIITSFYSLSEKLQNVQLPNNS